MLKLLSALLLALSLHAEPSIFDEPREDKFVNKNSQDENKKRQNDAMLERNMQRKMGIGVSAEQLKNIAPTDEQYLNLPDSQVYETVKKREVTLKTVSIPKSVFVGEIFELKLSVNPQSELEYIFETKVDESNVKWLNPKNTEWVKQSDGSYVALFFLQGKNEDAKSTKIELNLKRNGEIYHSGTMNLFLPKFKDLRARSDFSGVVADSLVVKKFKTTKFDETSLIMIVEMDAKNVDLASFNLPDKTLLKQGIDNVAGDFANQSGYFFAVFKPNKNSLDFSYYNLKSSKFESFSLPVSVEDDDVSTQIGLNPKQSEFITYKNIVLYGFSALFLVLSVVRRKVSYFIATALFVAASIYSYNPFSKGTLKPNASVKILPTTKSTIFYTSTTSESIEILNERTDYYKILFTDGKIGWVKKDDIIKN
ncbi:SH3 domain-containing protein [Campylobacter suis]|uniref:SH3 domain-containing protein n=1 Tax=Campylobacter suis TaxID=2790657 RepID=A0ABM8Q2W6_9BACT|nr:SH3 domain-containing protein [Campylobacter suis]CAD7287102.1 hypothetical protein LMG8286_00733 [Campylobacter suis]